MTPTHDYLHVNCVILAAAVLATRAAYQGAREMLRGAKILDARIVKNLGGAAGSVVVSAGPPTDVP